MTTPALSRRLQRVSDAARLQQEARDRAVSIWPQDEDAAWERIEAVLDALIECGVLPPPPPECSTTHADPTGCEACRAWQADIETRVRESLDEHFMTRDQMCAYVSGFAKLDEWPLTQQTWDMLKSWTPHELSHYTAF